ncbi:MAG TPA: TolC family protein [Alphaproteobacteria bacterium]|nr:TolC family protein [Alphaproteobacteria bacterium]
MGLLLPVTGCTNTPVALESADHYALLKQDQGNAGEFENQTVKITLSQALDRAVEANLDARVAAMEILVQQKNVTLKELEALPSLNYTRSLRERSNDGASSSRSVLSGLESLEPSQSSDRHRFVTEAGANWNLMDAVVALAEADRMRDETGITKERFTKVVQNIERDVYAAYWRAWAYQQTYKQTAGILAASRKQMANLNSAVEKNLLGTDEGGDKIAELTNRMRALQETSAALSLSETELKTLLSLPQSTRLILAKPPRRDGEIKSLLTAETIDQEWIALKARPEMREEVLQKNVAIKNIHHEILKTFPGGQLIANYNQDSNSFLQDNEWTDFSVSLVQNLLNVLTLPARFHAAQEKENLADARRAALNAAIVAQIHLGKIRLNTARSNWATASAASDAAYKKAFAKRAKTKTGLASGQDVVVANLDSQIELLRRYIADADMQDSYAAMINALGKNIDHDTLIASKESP